MDVNAIRLLSMDNAAKAGLSIPAHLPRLEDGLILRSRDDAVSRLLCLTAIGAASYGFDKAKSLAWLRQERLEAGLTKGEVAFLHEGEGLPQLFQVQIEGMWALAWALNFVAILDFWKNCDSRFVTMLPNLKANEAGDKWRLNARLRQPHEVIAACDLAYCLHWAVRQAEIERKPAPGNLKPYVVVERRRALEWLLSDEPWDGISLDT
jgi:hypothetical protein